MSEIASPTGGSGPGPWVTRMVTQLSTLSGVAPGKQILLGNPNRYFISFSLTAGSGNARVKPQSPVVNQEGFLVINGGAPLQFFFSQHGEITQEPWWIDSYSLSSPMLIVEGLWVPKGSD